MVPKLYGHSASPPVRSVLLTAKAINLELEFVKIDVSKNEHLTPEFLEINPEHTLPTLIDENFVIWDSHAINCYLVEKYGKNDSLYPKDLNKRAIINSRMHFNSGLLFKNLRDLIFPIGVLGVTTIPKDKIQEIIDVLDILEILLNGNLFVAGNELSVADFNIGTTVTSLELLTLFNVNEEKYPYIVKWLNRLKALPYYENANGSVKMFAGFINSKIRKSMIV